MPSKASSPRVRRTSDERQAEIAAAARKVALTRGLASVTLRAVAAEVGVTAALVAHYRPSMDELVAEVFASIVGEELREIESSVGGIADPVERMRALLTTLLDDAQDEVTLTWVQAWAAGRNEALAREVRAQMDAWVAFLGGQVREGVAVGAFAVSDPDGVARQMLGMIDGLNAHALIRWGTSQDRRTLMGLAVEASLGLERGALAA